jgi:hypothetical protein
MSPPSPAIPFPQRSSLELRDISPPCIAICWRAPKPRLPDRPRWKSCRPSVHGPSSPRPEQNPQSHAQLLRSKSEAPFHTQAYHHQCSQGLRSTSFDSNKMANLCARSGWRPWEQACPCPTLEHLNQIPIEPLVGLPDPSTPARTGHGLAIIAAGDGR